MQSLSIIIPTYNEEDYLPLLLSSIEHQTLRPLEVIVADAHSEDRTREIAKNYGARVVKGGMPGPGRNRGAQVANGDILLFLDADVILKSPTFLDDCVFEMQERHLDIATPDVSPMSSGFLDRIGHAGYNWYVRRMLFIRPHALGFCTFVTHELHEKIGGYDETVLFAEDNDYGYRANKIGKFGYLSRGIPTSTRRLERDGHIRIAIKYILAEFYIILFGPIKNNLFNYTFGYKKKD